jgi:hypothetical protein
MPDNHGVTKETDITAALVVVFVLMLAILIAKVANDFTKQTTSTDSKAAAPKAKTTVVKKSTSSKSGQAAPKAYGIGPQAYCKNEFDSYINTDVSKDSIVFAEKLFVQLDSKKINPDSCGDYAGGRVQFYSGPAVSVTTNNLYCCTKDKRVHYTRADAYCTYRPVVVHYANGSIKSFKSIEAKAKRSCSGDPDSNDPKNEYTQVLYNELTVVGTSININTGDITVKIPGTILKDANGYSYTSENPSGKCCIKPSSILN